MTSVHRPVPGPWFGVLGCLLVGVIGCSEEEPDLPSVPVAGARFDALPPVPAASAEGSSIGPGRSVDGEPLTLTIRDLSGFSTPAPAEGGRRIEIPEAIQALDGKDVVVLGFLLPIEMDEGTVKRFLVTDGSFGCCFDEAPAINQYVDARALEGCQLTSAPMMACQVRGILTVGEERDETGYVTSIYRLAATEVEEYRR